MELTELGLSEEQLAAVNKYTTGLKAKNDELLGEKKAEQQKVTDANEATEAARQTALQSEEARLKLAGDVDGLKKHYEDQLAEQVAAANQSAETARNALTDRDKGSVINEILSSVDDRYKQLVKTQLTQDTSIEYIDGKPVTSIKHGDDVYSSVEAFLDGVKDSEWKHYLKATSLSGAGTKQSNGGSAGKKPQDMTTAERIEFKQNDPVGFKQAFNL